MRVLPLLLLPVSALAGLPGEGDPVTSIDVRATTDPDTRLPTFLGVGVQSAIPLAAEDEAVPDLELRADLQANQVPPADIQTFIADNGGPDSVAYPRLRTRWSALASWGATSREGGLRLRAGPELVLDGDLGAMDALQYDETGFYSDYTLAARAGLTGAFGLAIPIGEAPEDPLVDVRVGASVLLPVHASGGGVGQAEVRDDLLTIDDVAYRPVDLLGRETRVWGEGTVNVGHLRVGALLGLHHRARSVHRAALARSPDTTVSDGAYPVTFLGQLRVGVVF